MATNAEKLGIASDVGPGGGEQRSERLNLRVTPTEAAEIRQAAEARRQSVTEFLVEAATAYAERAMTEDRRLVLMNEVFDRLVEEMDGPDQPVDALVELIKRPRRVQLPE
jgi:uncharacterized protein (DUF1778 family)